MNDRLRLALVRGDVTIDWNIAHIERDDGEAQDTTANWAAVSPQFGGAFFLSDLINEVAQQVNENVQPGWDVQPPSKPAGAVFPDHSFYHHSYSVCAGFPRNAQELRHGEVWRVAKFLGLDRRHQQVETSMEDDQSGNVVTDLLVIDDGGLGFRDDLKLWPAAVKENVTNNSWVLLKMANPIAQGALWEKLLENWSDRLVVVVSIEDLRRSEILVSQSLSWERTAQDLVWELSYNPQVSELARCAYVIVSFGTAGACLLAKSPLKLNVGDAAKSGRGWLFFDAMHIEDTWVERYPGDMFGSASCLTAEIARQIMLSPANPDIPSGIMRGLVAQRRLHINGFGEATARKALVVAVDKVLAEPKPEAGAISQANIRSSALVQSGGETAAAAEDFNRWTILEELHGDALSDLAAMVVRGGTAMALKGVPLGQFRRLLTVDRYEIESFRSIRALVYEYAQQERPAQPLSIAVFGPPGAGKSFAVEEVANSLLPGQIQRISFNLSQFTRPDDLRQALHQVRDEVLRGQIPLVFWDEFDTEFDHRPLGWLRYFLAPMQDGKFQEGQVTHAVGRAIFVFAGGTSSSMAEFDKAAIARRLRERSIATGVMSETVENKEADVEAENFRAAKGPDFVSRLKGFVDVMGPNPITRITGGGIDRLAIVRRAILLRSMLERIAPHLFVGGVGKGKLKIDSGVLRAFLHIGHYKHGSRSMEAIIAMSNLAGKQSFERSALPSEQLLDLHVRGIEFMALMRQIQLEGAVGVQKVEQLAEAVHSAYLRGKQESGDTSGVNESYADLSEEYKEQNRRNAREIPIKLARVGYAMIPHTNVGLPIDFPGDDLELLAKMEHENWLISKINAGWRYSQNRDDKLKTHPSMVPWTLLSAEEHKRRYPPGTVGDTPLSESEKEKDRVLVRAIPEILLHAGYVMVKLPGN